MKLLPDKKNHLIIIASRIFTLVQACTNDDLLENETVTQDTPGSTPITPQVREAEIETVAEAEVEAITITPPAPPVLSR